MPYLVLAVLAFFSLAIITNDLSTGFVLLGLIALLVAFYRKIEGLTQRLGQLEQALAEKSSTQQTEATSEQATAAPVPEVQSVVKPEPVAEQPIEPEAPVAAAKTIPQSQLVDKPAQSDIPPKVEPTENPFIEKAPPEPDIVSRIANRIFQAAWHWITDGNVFVRVGIIILFMGMTFLIRYAIGENLIPIELRLAAVAATAIALLAWGWTQRHKRSNFALVVQGGGIGLLYLTIFASFSLYKLIPSAAAFALLAITVLLAATLAILQDAKPLALFASIGGFLAPILTSSGSNNYIGLFSYYTVLNIGIFSIAWFKSWRILNFVGFVFTFLISAVWGVLSYRPEYFASTEPFLIIFFLLYVGIAILFAYRRAPHYKDYVDSSLIFGTPLLAFGMQCALVKDYEYGIAISAFVLAIFYLCLSYFLWQKYAERFRLLCETFLSLAVIFATVAIPFAIDGTLTGATWAIEGAGILWVSIKQLQKYRRFFAVSLIFAAGVILAYELIVSFNPQTAIDQMAFLNSAFIGCCLIAISASCASWLLSREFEGRYKIEIQIGYGLLAYSLLVLLGGFEYQLIKHNLFDHQGNWLAILGLVSGLLYLTAAKKLSWTMANWISLGLITLTVPAALFSFATQYQLVEYYGYLVWPVASIGYFYILYQTRVTIPAKLSLASHVLASTLIAGLLLWEGIWQLLLGFSLVAIGFNLLGDRFNWSQIKTCAALFLPVLVISSIAAIVVDGNLVALSSIGSSFNLPFAPGTALWPFAFATYFYLLYGNRNIGFRFNPQMHYGGGLLIAVMLLWLGLWPLLLGASLLCGLAYYLGRVLSWPEMRRISQALLPVMILTPILGLASGNMEPFKIPAFNLDLALMDRNGFLLWPLAFGVLCMTLWFSDREEKSAPELQHPLGLLLLTLIVTWEISWLTLDHLPFYNAWHLMLLPVMSLLAIISILLAWQWPFNRHQHSLSQFALIPLAAVTIIWSVLQLRSSGDAQPLPWIPLLNPIDIMQAIILMGWIWQGNRVIRRLPGQITQKQCLVALGGFVFIWINVDLLRGVHHWAGISWNLRELLIADISQTLLSLLWAILGLAVTFYATRKSSRQLWIAGAGLLGVVVLKLFLVDLAAQETIERIISFTGVGVLLTLVGYFSPIPPREESAEVETS